jgi:hypothetical protein
MAPSDFAQRAAPPKPDTACRQGACCSSPSSMCYWCTVSLAVWGFLSLVGMYWHPLHATSAVAILLAGSIGCFANWIKNRTFHCTITAWAFLAGAVVFLLANIGLIEIEPRFVWSTIAIATGVAFVLEWRYTRRPKGNQEL